MKYIVKKDTPKKHNGTNTVIKNGADMKIGTKAFILYIVMFFIILIIVLTAPTYGTIEITVDDEENITFTVSEDNSEEDVGMLLYYFPMHSLNSQYYEFKREVIDWDDLTYKSNITVGQLELMLPDGYEYLAKNFKYAEDKYEINAIFLIALSRLESGNMTYRLMDKNNIFSFKAYDDNIDVADEFDSIEQCIDFVAMYLKNEYLTESGMYYNGLSVEAVNDRYASDEEWASKLRDFY